MTSKLPFWISLNKSESSNKSACPQVSSIIRLYTNPDPLGLGNDLPERYHRYSQSAKRLRSQAYTKKTKNYSNICSPSYDSQIFLNESSWDEEYSHLQDKRVHFLTTNSRKGKYNSRQPHKKHKKLTSPGREPTSPVTENISQWGKTNLQWE